MKTKVKLVVDLHDPVISSSPDRQGDPALRMGAMNASSLSASNNGGRATNLKMAFH